MTCDLINDIRKYAKGLAPKLGIRGEDAEDLEQEMLLFCCDLMKKQEDVSRELIFHSVKRRAVDFARKSYMLKDRECQMGDEIEIIDDCINEDKLINLIHRQNRVRKLNQKQQKISEMELLGFTDEEKARELGVKVSTIWWQKHQIRKSMVKN